MPMGIANWTTPETNNAAQPPCIRHDLPNCYPLLNYHTDYLVWAFERIRKPISSLTLRTSAGVLAFALQLWQEVAALHRSSCSGPTDRALR